MRISLVQVCVWLSAALAATAAGARVLAPPDEPAQSRASERDVAALPATLAATGLYVDAHALAVDPAHIEYSPQYPLWSDGAEKRRWISLPPGSAIDARDPDAWVFPVGTRLWKQFSLDGRALETRFSERLTDGRWRFATYRWNQTGDGADLVSEFGASVAHADAPGGRYDIPSRDDCQACHGGARSPVLGFSALQLSSDRDPLAPHAEAAHAEMPDLEALVARGLLVNLPEALRARPPRIATADPLQRAVLGYLHGNCSHCHHRGPGAVPLALTLAQTTDGSAEEVLVSLLGTARYRTHDAVGAPRIVAPGDPETSVLSQRMRSREPMRQMPPLGTQQADSVALALIERWIRQISSTSTRGTPR